MLQHPQFYYHSTVLMIMIRIGNCPDICFPAVNLLTSPCIVNLSGQMPKLAGKYLMTGHYHKLCSIET